jgi:cytochrome c oxidase subunit 3
MEMKSLVTARGNPYLTIIWLSILGSGMIFLFLFFVFFTRMQGEDWQMIKMPPAYYFSTGTILLSSVSLQYAKRAFRHEQYAQYFQWMVFTGILALSFCLLQFAGWRTLFREGIGLGMISGAFVYILSGLHFLHILLGLAGLAWAIFDAYKNRNYVDGFILSLNPFKTSFISILSIFWHFLGILWILVFSILALQA